jgi:WD40 repeat protein
MATPRCSLALVVLSLFVLAPAGQAGPIARLDPHGDPLPPGARARLGTTRFRDGNHVTAAALAPDGKTLAVVSSGGLVRFLEVPSGKELRRFTGPVPSAYLLTFSPDGKVLATGDYSSGVQLWDTRTGNNLGRLTVAPQGRITQLIFSADGKIATGLPESYGQKFPVPVWEIPSGKQLPVIDPLHNYNIRGALSADGKVLATCGQFHVRTPADRGKEQEYNQTIQLWDTRTGKELRRLRIEGIYNVGSLAFSPDGKTLVTAAATSMLVFWDLATGKEVRRIATRRNMGLFIHYSPDGRKLAAAGQDGSVQIWDAVTGKRLGLFEGPRGRPARVSFPSDGRVLVCTTNGQSIEVWDVVAEKALTPSGGHQVGIASVRFAPDGKTLLSISGDAVSCLWDAATGKELRRRVLRDEEIARSAGSMRFQTALMAHDGKHLVLGDHSSLRLFELARGREVCSFMPTPQSSNPAAAFSPDSTLLATASFDHQTRASTVHIYDVSTGQEVKRFKGLRGTARSLAFAPDGKALAAGSVNYQGNSSHDLRVWDLANGKELWGIERPGSWMPVVSYSHDGKLLAATGPGGQLYLLEAATGKDVHTLPGDAASLSSSAAVFSPDGRALATATYQHDIRLARVRIWEVVSGAIRQDFVGHDGAVSVLAFSPDGKLLATGSTDTTVLLWDLTGREIADQPARGKPSAEELDRLWATLNDRNARIAFLAMRRLLDAPDDAAALLKKHVKPVESKAASAERMAKLIAGLDHDEFEQREQAMRQLESLGKAARAALEKALAANPTVETRRRIEELLGKMESKGPPVELMRPLRAVEVLENLGTAEARQLLEALAAGAEEAELTVAAQGALARLGRR